MKEKKFNIYLILGIFSLILLIGTAFAYYNYSHSYESEFITMTYNVKLDEEFYNDWGTKKVVIKNEETSNIPLVLRVSYDEMWSKEEDDSLNLLSNQVNGIDAATKEWTETFLNDFILKEDGWYYYTKLLKGNGTIEILNSIHKNEDVVIDNPLYNEYKYNLSFNYEAIQYSSDAIKDIWGMDITVDEDEVTWTINNDKISDLEFYLKGDQIVDIQLNDEYIESGYVAQSGMTSFASQVVVTSSLDTSRTGTYNITYYLHIGDYEETLTRTVNVLGDKYTVKLSTADMTNKDIVVTITSNIGDFSYFKTPTQNRVETSMIDYTVSENGSYTFYLYDTSGNSEKIELEISNIDKVPPSGTCRANVSGKMTTFIFNASDTGGVDHYQQDDTSWTSDTFSIDSVENNTFSIYDRAGNSTSVTCIYDPIEGESNPIYNGDTMKFWIDEYSEYEDNAGVKYNGYRLTRVWVKDSLNQLRTTSLDNGTLHLASAYWSDLINNKGYKNKAMIGINASSFIEKTSGDSFDNKLGWTVGTAMHESARSPLILNGGITIRDWTNNSSITNVFPAQSNIYPLYGLKKNGYLASYIYRGGVSPSENRDITAKIKDTDGVKNTFYMRPVLIEDYEVKSDNNFGTGGSTFCAEPNYRQAIGQIDPNNFVIISNIASVSDSKNIVSADRNGFTCDALAELMEKLNCRNGFNTDGGASVSYRYKKNTNSTTVVQDTSRKVADMLYFVEE